MHKTAEQRFTERILERTNRLGDTHEKMCVQIEPRKWRWFDKDSNFAGQDEACIDKPVLLDKDVIYKSISDSIYSCIKGVNPPMVAAHIMYDDEDYDAPLTLVIAPQIKHEDAYQDEIEPGLWILETTY